MSMPDAPTYNPSLSNDIVWEFLVDSDWEASAAPGPVNPIHILATQETYLFHSNRRGAPHPSV